MEKIFQPIKQNHAKKRPKYLTILSIILIIWGVGCSLALGAGTLKIIMTGARGGPAFAFFRVLLMQAIWIAIAVSGIGIYRGWDWARGLFFATLIALFFAIATTVSFGSLIGAALIYAFLIYMLFTPRAKVYFSKSE